MKDSTFDAHIVAASPHSDETKNFVKRTMQKITAQTPHKKRGFVEWFTHLHKPAIALSAFVAIILLGGAVYAAVHFAPALLQMLGKETNQRGATEYSFAGFKDCSENEHNVAERFEVKKDANLSDEEVQKIIQAKCELKWLQSFPGKVWPTTGTNPAWKDGDTIYYTRLDMLGHYKGGSDTKATVDTGDNAIDFTTPQGEKIRAFAAGEEIKHSDLKPGDTVFTISRISETYRNMNKYGWDKPKNELNLAPPQEQPKVIGLVALFKMSLPYEYYMQKQQLVTEIPECMGNPGEYCANTPSIDVYPRTSGEGASNPYATPIANGEYREISGTVIELGDDTLTLKSRNGNSYTITVGDAGFKVYNRDYASAYSDIDAKVKVGSNVAVRYNQPKNADAKTITKEQVQRVVLQLEGINPKKSVKQY